MGLLGKYTEKRNAASFRIDTKSSREILEIINEEDQKVPLAVKAAIGEIAATVDAVVSVFNNGGRLFYIGAGTSGRLGVLDASECPPTYGVDKTMVTGIIAGGDFALRNSIEGAEDDREQGVADVKDAGLTSRDALIGISANGDAPYVCGALEYAASIGAFVSMIASNRNAKGFDYVAPEHRIAVIVGPEVITGSTRMKAGTAQKLVLNMITTASMIRIGKVYDNYMVDMRPVNDKLVERAVSMISDISGADSRKARDLLQEAGGNVKLSIVMAITGMGQEESRRLLETHHGNIHFAVDGRAD